MIFNIPAADLIIGIAALFFVALCIFTVFRKKKKCCSSCKECMYSEQCKGKSKNSAVNNDDTKQSS